MRSKPRIHVPCCTPRAQSGAACWEEIIVRQNARLRSRVRRTLQRAGVRPRADQVEELTREGILVREPAVTQHAGRR